MMAREYIKIPKKFRGFSRYFQLTSKSFLEIQGFSRKISGSFQNVLRRFSGEVLKMLCMKLFQ